MLCSHISILRFLPCMPHKSDVKDANNITISLSNDGLGVGWGQGDLVNRLQYCFLYQIHSSLQYLLKDSTTTRQDSYA